MLTTWKTEGTVLHLLLSLGVLSCWNVCGFTYARSWTRPLLSCSATIRSAADPWLLREAVILPDNCLLYFCIKSTYSFFSIASLYPSWQATLHVYAINICKGVPVLLSWTDSARRKSVSWSSLLATQPSHLFMGCQRYSQILCTDSPTILNFFPSAFVANKHIP